MEMPAAVRHELEMPLLEQEDVIEHHRYKTHLVTHSKPNQYLHITLLSLSLLNIVALCFAACDPITSPSCPKNKITYAALLETISNLCIVILLVEHIFKCINEYRESQRPRYITV